MIFGLSITVAGMAFAQNGSLNLDQPGNIIHYPGINTIDPQQHLIDQCFTLLRQNPGTKVWESYNQKICFETSEESDSTYRATFETPYTVMGYNEGGQVYKPTKPFDNMVDAFDKIGIEVELEPSYVSHARFVMNHLTQVNADNSSDTLHLQSTQNKDQQIKIKCGQARNLSKEEFKTYQQRNEIIGLNAERIQKFKQTYNLDLSESNLGVIEMPFSIYDDLIKASYSEDNNDNTAVEFVIEKQFIEKKTQLAMLSCELTAPVDGRILMVPLLDK